MPEKTYLVALKLYGSSVLRYVDCSEARKLLCASKPQNGRTYVTITDILQVETSPAGVIMTKRIGVSELEKLLE